MIKNIFYLTFHPLPSPTPKTPVWLAPSMNSALAESHCGIKWAILESCFTFQSNKEVSFPAGIADSSLHLQLKELE